MPLVPLDHALDLGHALGLVPVVGENHINKSTRNTSIDQKRVDQAMRLEGIVHRPEISVPLAV